LSSVGIKFDEEVRALILLSSLPKSWNVIVIIVSISSRSNKLKFDDVCDLVLNEEIRRKEFFKNYVPRILGKAMVENEPRLKIKKIRTNNGGEYEDNRFKKFCYEHGIRMEKTVLGTPQHNGVVERMNRMSIERAKSLCLQSCLPKQL